jgi:ketosteroid isomerase-like protein
MSFTGPLEDRILIRERIGTYSDSICRADLDEWLGCWTDDAVRIHDGAEVSGKPELRAFWDMIWSAVEQMGFFTEIGAISVDGDRAVARCYTREIMTFHGGGSMKVVGVYDDELVRERGEWLFARRSYQMLMEV